MSERLTAVDLARTAALAGMVIYHFTYDLELFGYLSAGTAFAPPFSTLAKLVAGSFLAIAGVSLVLAHGDGVRRRAFGRQMAKVGGAALAISALTWVAMPDTFIYFGILHAIAVMSVLCLPLVGRSVIWSILAFGVVFVLWWTVANQLFDSVWLGWTGLSQTVRPTVDFEPLVPWLLPFLGGVILGQLGRPILVVLSPDPTAPGVRALTWPGRHSLILYLLHQPVLIGLLWVWGQI